MIAGMMLFAEWTGSFSHYLIWSGLFALLLAPAVLARTRWSESPPLLICVSLSVVAHLLLTIYAYAIRLPHGDAGPGAGGDMAGEVVIALQLLDDANSVAESAAAAEPQPRSFEANDTASDAMNSSESATGQDIDASPKVEPIAESDVAPSAVAASKAAPPSVFPSNTAPPPTVSPTAIVAALPAGPTELVDPSHSADPNDPSATDRVPNTPNDPATATATASAAAADTEDRYAPTNPARKSDAEARAAEASNAEASDAPNSPEAAKAAEASAAEANRAEANVAESKAAQDRPDTDSERQNAEPANREPLRTAANDSRPTESQPPAEPRPAPTTAVSPAVPLAYRNRQLNRRFENALRQGGSADTEAAVEAALDWLAAQQTPEGVWAAAATGAGREARVLGQDRGGAGAHADAGLTALALLAFLGAGETHLEGGRRQSVQHGLEYLLRIQRADGELAGSADLFARMYCHGMATLAISEAYALTGDARLRPALDAAIGYTVRAQDPNGGGWRYRPGDSGDTSQFGWQLMSLKSAQLAGLPIPPTVWERARKFLRSVSSGTDSGLASYRPGERPSRTMTAEALFCRILLDDSQPAQAREALRFVAQEPPGVGPDNHYYWYYGTLAQFQTQSDSWRGWNAALQRQLLARQHPAGPLRGSWDPDTVWGTHGGRVFSTALSALSLEVYYRYLPLYQTARAGTR